MLSFLTIYLAQYMSFSAVKNAIISIGEVADYLKCTERTIYRLAGAKQIPAFKVGGSWRFSLADIDVWIKEQSVERNQTVREHEGAKGKRAADGGQN